MPITEVKRKDLQAFLDECANKYRQVTFVTPAMLAFFATAPERYEVTEYLIVWEPKPTE